MKILSDELCVALNKQIGHELYNAHQYLDVAAWFKQRCLFNLADIYFAQAKEEDTHAEKLINFVVDMRGKLSIPSVGATIDNFVKAEDAAQLALLREEITTEDIYKLVSLAWSEGNYIAWNFLQWFVNEQQSELSEATDRLQLIQQNRDNLLLVDHYLGDKE